MFKESNKFEKFESKVWLSSPTMHGPEIEYVKEAYETNWMSTVGKNINEVEKLACEYIGCKYAVALSAGTASLHLAMKLAGIEAYGMPKVGHGALEGKKVFCSDMTFAASLNHETNVQEYKINTFGFHKAYCKMHIQYRPCIYPIVKILYRFRHLLKRLDGNKLIHAINTVLQMEEIARM